MVPFRSACAILAGGLLVLTATAAHAQPYRGTWAPGPYERSWPIFMTSINYPGLYGAHMASVPAVAYNTRTSADRFVSLAATAPLPPPPPPVTETPSPPAPPGPAADAARVNVLLPSEATLTIQGVPMSQTGAFREFISPPLVPGPDYRYTIRAAWTANGRPVTQERVVHVRPGERVDVDLMTSPPPRESTSTLRPRPLP